MAHNSPKEVTDLARKGPQFPLGGKLEAFTVMYSNYCFDADEFFNSGYLNSPRAIPCDHLLLDSAPNFGPLISRWGINKFKYC